MSEPVNEFVFDDISLKEIPVKFGAKTYTLREADGEAVRRYRNECLKSYHYNDEGAVQSITGMADTKTLLLSYCLYDENNKPVPIGVVRTWPNRIVEPLVKWIREVSEMDEEETVATVTKQIADLQKKLKKLKAGDAAKNEQDGITTGIE